jgi:hypothetical protein
MPRNRCTSGTSLSLIVVAEIDGPKNVRDATVHIQKGKPDQQPISHLGFAVVENRSAISRKGKRAVIEWRTRGLPAGLGVQICLLRCPA